MSTYYLARKELLLSICTGGHVLIGIAEGEKGATSTVLAILLCNSKIYG